MEIRFRLLMVTTMSACLMAVLPGAAQAHHRPNFYCSESGDLCQSTRRVEGKRKLGLLLPARYFPTFHLGTD